MKLHTVNQKNMPRLFLRYFWFRFLMANIYDFFPFQSEKNISGHTWNNIYHLCCISALSDKKICSKYQQYLYIFTIKIVFEQTM